MSIDFRNPREIASVGTLLGDVKGTTFYRLAVVVGTRNDQIESWLADEWENTVEAELLRTRTLQERARQELLELRQAPRQLPDPEQTGEQIVVTAAQGAGFDTETRALVRCPKCKRRFASAKDYDRHICTGTVIVSATKERQPVRPVTTPAPERHQCPACDKVFDSTQHLATHTCQPREALEADAPDDPERLTIPADPVEADLLLEQLTAGAWPHPCPECWREGIVAMCKGAAGMGSHRFKSHGVQGTHPTAKNQGNPPPVADANGFRCRECKSGTFAPSVRDPEVCVRCMRKEVQAA